MAKVVEQKISDLYLSNLDMIGEGFPEAVNSIRGDMLANFMLLGLPCSKDERYRHSDIRSYYDGEWEQYFTKPHCHSKNSFPLEGCQLILTNGFTQGEMTQTEQGVVYGSLQKGLSANIPAVLSLYNSIVDNENESLTALNSAFVQDGAFIYMPEDISSDKPFVISLDCHSQDNRLMSYGRVLIVAEKNSSANIYISHNNSSEAEVLSNNVIEVICGENAELNITYLDNKSSKDTCLTGLYVSQGANSKCKIQGLWFNGSRTRFTANVDLQRQYADFKLYGLYFSTERQNCDINLTVNHNSADCISSELVKGIVSGEGVGAFTGKVYVAKDAQRTSAFQQSRNLQLSDNAKIFTEPQLEIYADDVKCSHGATVGQMDDEAVYYMRQRGISEAEAKKLQLYGFMNDIISHCSDEVVCEYINSIAADVVTTL